MIEYEGKTEYKCVSQCDHLLRSGKSGNYECVESCESGEYISSNNICVNRCQPSVIDNRIIVTLTRVGNEI